MIGDRTAARPYAEAVFQLAHEHGRLARWSEMLQRMAAVASVPAVASLAQDPDVARARLLDLFLEICGPGLDEDGRGLVRVLVEGRRLGVLGEIARMYEERRARAEGRVEATVVSARPLEPAQQRSIEQALARRFTGTVHLDVRVDPSLLGGIVIRAGDQVIDGSIRGRLQTLASQLLG